MGALTKLAEAIHLLAELDCGDNSCLFAAKKGGKRTNGGCRCLDSKVMSGEDRRNLNRLALVLREARAVVIAETLGLLTVKR